MAYGRRCLLAVVASVLVSGTPLRSTEPITEVPFELHQRHLVVTKGSIGRLDNLNLLIDTGTIPSAVDSRIARKLRLQTEPAMLVAFGQRVPIQSAVLDGLRIGSLQSGPVPAGVGDLSYLQGAHIDAIVGLDVLARTNFSIDYRTRVLKFAPEGREDASAPLDVVWPFVTVTMTIEGEKVRLLVDTGSSDSCCSRRGCRPLSPVRRGEATRRCSMRPAPRACAGSNCATSASERMSGTSCQPGRSIRAAGIPAEHRRRARCNGPRLPASAVRLRTKRARVEPVNHPLSSGVA